MVLGVLQAGIYAVGGEDSALSMKGHARVDATERQELIDQYKAGYDTILQSLSDMTDAEWDAREAPGEWSPREIIHHLGESEMTSAMRLRLLLVEDGPTLIGYDQDAFARKLHYDRPVDASLAAFKAARETTAELLDRMSEDDWKRSGTHSESGHYTVEDWLRIYAAHAPEHADQIRRARAGV